ncbi:MAG: hypothetical protein SVY10_02165, partial [Thermodesulfobacteriota bacterium]|nr:hypothetical protein [Thermodesulfobacteriota bacterium]
MKTTSFINNRILVIDDNEEIHRDFKAILEKKNGCPALRQMETDLFGKAPPESKHLGFHIDSAYQGDDGYELVKKSVQTNQPYAIAFVDMHMPPGWNGLQTIVRLWEVDPDIQAVIC